MAQLTKLRAVLRRARPVPQASLEVKLRWEFVDAADTAAHPGLLVDLIDRKIDGMMVRGVFSPEEAAAAVPRLEALRPLANPEPFGAMLGMPINELGSCQDPTAFVDSAEQMLPHYREAFGFDPHERLRSVLAPMAGDLDIGPPTYQGRHYNPGNARWYDPGKGGLPTHAGSEFVDIAGEGALSHLLTVNEIRDHMSYFIVLQKPDVGGDLSVYDLLFADRPDCLPVWTEAARDDTYFESVPRMVLEPGPGDLILFGGGWRYHRVDPVEGTRPRMTYGGFAHLSRDGRTIHMWC